MIYIPEESKVLYQSKDGKEEKIFDALEWPRQKAAGCWHSLAMCSHIPNKGEQMVRYYGHLSNVARDIRKKQDEDGLIPSILEPEGSSEEFRKNWARLIKEVYQVDPLTCVKCGGRMKILSFIVDPEIIKKIVKHLDLWPVESLKVERDVKPRPSLKATGPQKTPEYGISLPKRI